MSDSNATPTGLSFADAHRCVSETAARQRLPTQSVPLDQACGRILAEDVRAPRDIPGYANSAMDGFAVRGKDLPTGGEKAFALLGQVLAGDERAPELMADGCVRVTTGAIVPEGADTVVIKENTRSDGDRIYVQAGTPVGANVRATDEDYRAGDMALARGSRLGPAQVAALAGFGFTRVPVACQPRAAVMTTGDELVEPGQPLARGQIYDSNRYAITGLLRAQGVVDIDHQRVLDNPQHLESALHKAAAGADILITCGGVSAGEADYLPGIVAKIGQVHFHKVKLRPGMPFLFGRIGNALLFGLPGNPVSGYVTFLTLVVPALRALCGLEASGTTLKARLTTAIRKRHTRTEFQRARVECDDDGVLWASPYARQGSSILRSLAECEILITLPGDVHEFSRGDVVDILPLPGWPG